MPAFASGLARRLRPRMTRVEPAQLGPPPRTGVIGLVFLAQWFGLATGLIELVALLVRNHFYGAATLGALQLSRHFTWMIPATHLLIFSAVGVALAPMALIRSRWGARVAVFLIGGISLFGLLATIPGLHAAAVAVLAAGVSARLVPMIEARKAGMRTLVRITLPLMMMLVAGLAGLRYYQLSAAEKVARSMLPPAAPGAPNVLLIVMDTVRADRLSLHGYERDTTPNLVRLSKRGIRFDKARSAAAWTLPSHASMFTGRLPNELQVFVNRPLDGTYPTVAEFLRDRGYNTSGFVANTHFCNSWFGLDRGFLHYEDYYAANLVLSLTETFRSAELGRRILQVTVANHNVRPGETNQRKDAAQINRDFLGWLSQQKDRPFFTFLNYYDAHDPYLPPNGFDRAFGVKPTTTADIQLLQSPHVNQKLASGDGITPRDVALVRDAYDDCIAYLDEQLGKLIDELDRRGVLDNTLVIVTSDHGEHLGEHKIYGHGQSLYQPEIHVPLLVTLPKGQHAGTTSPDPVSLRDLAATVVDTVARGAKSPFPGKSLARFWDGTTRTDDPFADPAISELVRGTHADPKIKWPPALRGPMESLATHDKVYIRNGDGTEEIYNIKTDPEELHDLSKTDAGKADIERFRAVSRQLRDEKTRVK